MANTKATEKPGTKVTFSDGSTGFVTKGSQYRIDSGPNKDKLWTGAAPGTAAGGAAGGNYTPDLTAAKAKLQAQVGTGPNNISQSAADAEFSRLQSGTANGTIRIGPDGVELPPGPGGSLQAPAGPLAYPYGPTPQVNAVTPGTFGSDAINQQAGLNRQNLGQQETLNRPNEINPLGASQYYQDPVTGQISRVSTVGNMTGDQLTQSGNNQANQFLNSQNLALGTQGVANQSLSNLRGLLSSPIDPNQFGAERDKTTQSQYDQAIRLLQPQMDQQRQQFEQSQADRGLHAGSGENYDRNSQTFARNQNDAYQSAAFNAMGAGNAEQQRLFQNSLNARSGQLGEFSGLLGLAPTQLPQFQSTQSLNVPNLDVVNPFLANQQNQTSIQNAQLGVSSTLGAANIAANASMANNSNSNATQSSIAQQQIAANQQLAQQQQQYALQNRPNFFNQLGGAAATGLFSAIGGGIFGGSNSGSGSGFLSSLNPFR